MKFSLSFIIFSFLASTANICIAQTITYSQIEKADSRNMNFEILGNFANNYLVYKNLNKRQNLTVYDNNMGIINEIKLGFISDRTYNIDFITYPTHFLIVWQFEKGNTIYCKAASMNGEGKLLGLVKELDSTRQGVFSNKTSYSFTWSEDKKKLLLYKIQNKSDVYNQVTKVYDENFTLLDSSRSTITYNDNREDFGDLQIDNDGNILFTKIKENAREEFINSLELNFKKLKAQQFVTVSIPLDKQLIQDPIIKIDNLNKNYIINTFSYKKNGGNIDGMLTAIINRDSFKLINKVINIFNDSLRSKLSGKPDWRTAYDNLNIRNIILKKDGGFLALTEEYIKQRRFGNTFDNRFNNFNGRYYNSFSDYNLYNRGYYGYYRPFNDGNGRDIVYNYNDIINFSFNKDLKLQWSSVINKTTSDVENDNFLSFTNLNAGGEIYFLFLQKDNNRQILSNHALQPDGNIKRYATLKGREAGYNFMPRLARQTGARQMIVPCIVRNNIAFAKIDF